MGLAEPGGESLRLDRTHPAATSAGPRSPRPGIALPPLGGGCGGREDGRGDRGSGWGGRSLGFPAEIWGPAAG